MANTSSGRSLSFGKRGKRTGKSAAPSGKRIGSSFIPKRSSGTADTYDRYTLSVRELLRDVAISAGLILLFAYVFFDSLVLGAVLGIPGTLLFLKYRKKYYVDKRKWALKRQFLTAASLLGDYLRSGYSIENAIVRSERELCSLWGEGSDIVREWRTIGNSMSLSKTPEESFRDFGRRSDISKISDFADLFRVVKRTDGQLADVMAGFAANLSEEFVVEEQIRTMIASKKLEQRIMDVMPVAIILYLRISQASLLSPLYTTFAGRVTMIVCLAVYIAGALIAEKIMNIRM